VDLDLIGMLERGIQAALGGSPDVVVQIEEGSKRTATAVLSTTTADPVRSARIYVPGTGLFDLTIPELRVGASLFEHDDPAYMELIVRELAFVAGAYLRGEGTVDQRRGLFGTRSRLTLVIDEHEWILGRHTSRERYPADGS
jgi:hypothetical protein